jgi:hypothetical protein
MSDYERQTTLPSREIWERVHEILTTRGELSLTRESHHERTYAGGEGTVAVDVHRHGLYTVVTFRTDRLRTSKVDSVVRHAMNQLPYQPGDPPRE